MITITIAHRTASAACFVGLTVPACIIMSVCRFNQCIADTAQVILRAGGRCHLWPVTYRRHPLSAVFTCIVAGTGICRPGNIMSALFLHQYTAHITVEILRAAASADEVINLYRYGAAPGHSAASKNNIGILCCLAPAYRSVHTGIRIHRVTCPRCSPVKAS